MDLTITLSTKDSDALVELAGVLDFASTPFVRRLVFELCDQHLDRIVVDVRRVRLVDAAAIGVLLYLQRHASQRGADLVVTEATDIVLQTLEIAGVAKRLGVFEEVCWPEADRNRRAVDVADLGAHHGGWPPTLTGDLARMHRLAVDDPRRRRLRDSIVEQAMPAAQRLARRFIGTGEPIADLAQVAALGLIKAVDRFDIEFGTDFGVYATPTILGELKRYLRDCAWSIRVPRRTQEMRIRVSQSREELTHRLRRTATAGDLAAHLDIGEDEIATVRVAASAYQPDSIERPLTGDTETTWLDLIGDEEREYAMVDNRESLKLLIRQLPRREQAILSMRFYGNMNQSEIAERIGVSQMHISRILKRTLDKLRRGLNAEA
jgi:RNA polymerase sigma-B factor